MAVALVRTGSGNVRLNGCPITTVKPDILRVKVYEPLLLLGEKHFGKARPQPLSRNFGASHIEIIL